MDIQEKSTLNEDSSANRHTEDMQEIITKVPSWILRWGIMVFFGILLMVVVISIFVRYPDTVKGGLKLASSDISVPVIAASPGRITKLLIKQGSTVKKGQLLANVETSNIPNEEYPLYAPRDGTVSFVGIVQQGVFLLANQEVFYIHPKNEQFFGIMEVPSNTNKIKIGQTVLINLRNYPADEYGQLTGTISYMADEPTKNGFFVIKVTLNTSDLKKQIQLKSWMAGDAEIITQDVSIQRRIFKSIFKWQH